MAVEAYHAGIIRTLLSSEISTVVTPYNVPVSAVTKGITDLQDTLLGLVRDQSIGPSIGPSNLTPTDTDALAYLVTPSQVLNVVYGSVTTSKGLFFPNGLTGLLRKVISFFAFSKLNYLFFGYFDPKNVHFLIIKLKIIGVT